MTIKRIERNKRKFITGVHGLEAFGTLSLRTKDVGGPNEIGILTINVGCRY